MPALLLFRIAGRRLALPLDTVRNVAPVPLLRRPVGAPPFVEGFLDFQGEPVAAIRPDRLLDLDEEDLGIYAPLLVLGDAARGIALHVARIDQVMRVDDIVIEPIGDDDAQRVRDRPDRLRQRNVWLLSASRLLLDAERETVAAHAVMKRRRLDALDTGPCDGATDAR